MTEDNKADDNKNTDKIKDEWMIRDCSIYDEEYSDCTSIKARFNQLFIFGKVQDCIQWKKDSDNCYKFCNDNDLTAAAQLIQSEKNRRKERLLSHLKNNVWTKRDGPPKNWDSPLPKRLQEQYEGSYLALKSKEMKGEIEPAYDPFFRSCTIL
ncbi:UPF0545 protein C22orf39 homolog [Sitophilus oryzae]|uniref:Synaptic plasticity regulator PANTS n=1 Tax=Sitophilus oryzae TaxID=7048 RepID=A0A6J2YMY7_SITOR|nr:UPF0545 protein C22orf39 homolog [Sitophilus oryzae]